MPSSFLCPVCEGQGFVYREKYGGEDDKLDCQYCCELGVTAPTGRVERVPKFLIGVPCLLSEVERAWKMGEKAAFDGIKPDEGLMATNLSKFEECVAFLEGHRTISGHNIGFAGDVTPL